MKQELLHEYYCIYTLNYKIIKTNTYMQYIQAFLQTYHDFFFYFLGFSPTNFLENSGLTVSDNIEDIILSQVLEKMGITDYLQTPQCDLMDYTDTVDGWTNGQIMSYCLYLFVTHVE